MEARYEASRVRTLSDQELLAGLSGALGSSRQLVALVVVHLGEVEERRLHLIAGQASLFAYCTERLGMSEDEAYRRIEVARLARRFPLLIEHLATGRISLSVAALLRVHLTQVNHVELLDALASKTVKQAREVLAAWFPRPDVVPSIRKLPQCSAGARVPGGAERASSDERSFESAGAEGAQDGAVPSEVALAPRRANQAVERADARIPAPGSLFAESAPGARGIAMHPAASARTPAPARAKRASFDIEPLSVERYKIVFTADAELKQKLDLARDLLRHALPDGDLAAIIGRALDLLLEKTLQRRFAKTTRCSAAAVTDAAATHAASTRGLATSAAAPTAEHPGAEPIASDDVRTTPADDASAVDAANDRASTVAGQLPHDALSLAKAASRQRRSGGDDEPSNAIPLRSDSLRDERQAASRDADTSPRPSSTARTPAPAPEPQPHLSRHLPSQVRRAALERDGLRCTFIGSDGVRCNSRAWLEHDHIVPRGLGGSDDPTNIRLRCRPHNRLAAEQAYGQAAIERIIAQRRARKDPEQTADGHRGTRENGRSHDASPHQ